MSEQKLVAVIRVRGLVNRKSRIEKTLKMLKLYKKHTCVIIPNTPAFSGMLKHVQEYVTWGEIDESTLKDLLSKKGRLAGKVKLSEDYLKDKVKTDITTFVKDLMAMKKTLKDVPGLKTFFKLAPPLKGFERKGIKKPFSLGGALGYRKEKINELLGRMIY